MITESQLRQIMPNLSQGKCQLYLPALNRAMATCEVNTMLRVAAFVAQLAHESGEFRWMEEIWGPTSAQRRYEPPSDLAKRLGNTQPGDGKRYKGRGPIQITGRYNYKKYGDLLGVDLINQPELAAKPEAAFATAGLFWKSNGLNELADKAQFVTITRRINGGTNGLEDRKRYYARAKDVLATGFVPDAGTTRGAAKVAAPVTSGPLTRGYEAITEDINATAPDRAVKKKAAAKKKSVAKKKPAKKTAKVAVKKPQAKKAASKKAATKKTVTKKTVAKAEAR
jgi:predicted chitinase